MLLKHYDMHDIEPHFLWRKDYIASRDERSPFYGREYDEFYFTNKIYNYFIHPQWDGFGSPTLYLKILFVDYHEGYAILELIGEWNDALHNDIMTLKREVIESLMEQHIYRFILICENVLNFHSSDDCYYEEWHEEVVEEGGWVCLLNTLQHVEEEMAGERLHFFLRFGPPFNDINWRPQKPAHLYRAVATLMENAERGIHY